MLMHRIEGFSKLKVGKQADVIAAVAVGKGLTVAGP
jgi:hypothetical protein